MKKWKIVLIGGGGLGLAYIIWRTTQAQAAEIPPIGTDEWGNPDGTEYGPTGRPMPPRPDFPWTRVEGMSAQQAAIYFIKADQNDITVPSIAGGLRFASDGLLLDSRMRLSGKLQYPLKAKDRELSAGNRTDGLGKWTKGSYYRIEVEGEPMLVRCRGKLRSFRGMTFTIIERPDMSNWQDPRAESWRTPQYDAEGDEMWPQYTQTANPTYGRQGFLEVVRQDAWIEGLGLLQGGETIWVNEIRHNCRNSTYDDLGEYRVWDARLGECRAMTAEEIERYHAWQEQNATIREAAQDETSAQREQAAQTFFGLSWRELQGYNNYWNRPDAPGFDEIEVRNQAIIERTELSQPADLYSYAPDLATGGVRAVPFGTASVDVAVRRAWGKARYDALNPLIRREFHRDWYSAIRSGSRSLGRNGMIGVGGFYGLAAIWGAPAQPKVYLAPTRPTGVAQMRTTKTLRAV